MNFECETFGLKGRSSGSIFDQVNALHRNWPMADCYLKLCKHTVITLSMLTLIPVPPPSADTYPFIVEEILIKSCPGLVHLLLGICLVLAAVIIAIVVLPGWRKTDREEKMVNQRDR